MLGIQSGLYFLPGLSSWLSSQQAPWAAPDRQGPYKAVSDISTTLSQVCVSGEKVIVTVLVISDEEKEAQGSVGQWSVLPSCPSVHTRLSPTQCSPGHTIPPQHRCLRSSPRGAQEGACCWSWYYSQMPARKLPPTLSSAPSTAGQGPPGVTNGGRGLGQGAPRQCLVHE